MSAFIGVSRYKDRLRLSENALTYWCAAKAHKVQEGDLLFLYFTAVGIKQVYRVTLANDEETESTCEFRGMKTIRMTLLVNLQAPVTARLMKEDPVLQSMPAVGRNFQGTLFRVTDEQIDALWDLVQAINVGFDTSSVFQS